MGRRMATGAPPPYAPSCGAIAPGEATAPALAAAAGGKNAAAPPPYGSSSLTLLLQEALGGTSALVLLASLPRGAGELPRARATLQLASRCRRIVNQPRRNVETLDPQKRERRASAKRSATSPNTRVAAKGGERGVDDGAASAPPSEGGSAVRGHAMEASASVATALNCSHQPGSRARASVAWHTAPTLAGDHDRDRDRRSGSRGVPRAPLPPQPQQRPPPATPAAATPTGAAPAWDVGSPALAAFDGVSPPGAVTDALVQQGLALFLGDDAPVDTPPAATPVAAAAQPPRARCLRRVHRSCSRRTRAACYPARRRCCAHRSCSPSTVTRR